MFFTSMFYILYSTFYILYSFSSCLGVLVAMCLLPNTKYCFVPLCLRGYIYIKLAPFYRIFVKNFGGRVYKFLSALEKKFLIFSKRASKNLRILTKWIKRDRIQKLVFSISLTGFAGLGICIALKRDENSKFWLDCLRHCGIIKTVEGCS